MEVEVPTKHPEPRQEELHDHRPQRDPREDDVRALCFADGDGRHGCAPFPCRSRLLSPTSSVQGWRSGSVTAAATTARVGRFGGNDASADGWGSAWATLARPRLLLHALEGLLDQGLQRRQV